MASKIHPFHYEPLDVSKYEIRVLQILKGDPASELCCTLKNISLETSASYEALSYAWHDPSLFPDEGRQQNEIIRVNDQYLKIGNNLLSFLQTTRMTRPHCGPIWIDAICINQNNVTERNSQILRMRKIYQMARQVVVWLGPPSGESDKAVEFLTFVSRHCPVGHESEWFGVLLRTAQFSTQWTALTRLLWRVWWGRMWVVQEVVLAREVMLHCGTALLRWTDLEYAIANIAEALDDAWKNIQVFGGLTIVRDRVKVIARLTSLRRKRNELTSLHILDSVGGNECTNPRDKIFGLLGLIKESRLVVPAPDYTRSAENIYRNFFVALAQKTETLDFLSLVQNRIDESNSSTLPTWCPDLRARGDRATPSLSTILLLSANETPQFSAAANKTMVIRSSRDRSIITVLGLIIDAIDGVFPGGLDDSLTLKYTVQARSSASAYGGEATTFRALWQTFVGGLNLGTVSRDYSPPPAFHDLFVESCSAAEEEHNDLCAQGRETLFDIKHPLKLPVFVDDDVIRTFNTWYKYNRAGNFAGQSISAWAEANIPPPAEANVAVVTPVEESPAFPAFKQSWSNANSGRRMVTTEKGYIGMVPELCRRGDLVCVLFGCHMPVVLRTNKDGHYIFIGEGYVHGLMNGEAIEDYKKRMYRTQEFELR